MGDKKNLAQMEMEMAKNFKDSNLTLCMDDVKRQCLITFLLDVPLAKEAQDTATGTGLSVNFFYSFELMKN